MADEATPAPVDEAQDTPTPEAPDVSQDTPETDATQSVDYEKRYQDLQPEYTRATQEAAQYRDFIERVQAMDPEALRSLGLEFEEPDDEGFDEDDDPDAPLTRAEWNEWQQAQQEEHQAAESEQAFNNDLWSAVEAIEEKEGREITDEEAAILRDSALAQVVRGGDFDLSSTWDSLQSQAKAAHERYVNTKRTAPVAPLGSAGEEKIDLNDEDARQDLLKRVMDAESEREA